jgi:dTDP-4-amino-4,6-dideoxygalactose transaminase
MIPYNVPLVTPDAKKNLEEALACPESLQGGGRFGRECIQRIGNLSPASKVYLTTSCTSALELAAILIDVKSGDEVIVPSYTYVSTANAFLLRGATIVYVDIDPTTMNMDIKLVEQAMTAKTVAVVPVHYGGSSCDMDPLLSIAEQRGIFVIEDAAQAYSATYKSRALGTIGHIGCFSFHATKNYTAGGQGGAIVVNDPRMHARADVVYENGTNRREFARGEKSCYEWQDLGSNFQMSEIAAACLAAQLAKVAEINADRRTIWNKYYQALAPLQQRQILELPRIPAYAAHNSHIFWLKWHSEVSRQSFIRFMGEAEISVAFHYVPLHSTPIGRATGRFSGPDLFTSREASRVVRLPLYRTLSGKQQDEVISRIFAFAKTIDHKALLSCL